MEPSPIEPSIFEIYLIHSYCQNCNWDRNKNQFATYENEKKRKKKKHPKRAHCHLPTNDANNLLWVTHIPISQWPYADCSSKYDMCVHFVINSEKKDTIRPKTTTALGKLFSFIFRLFFVFNICSKQTNPKVFPFSAMTHYTFCFCCSFYSFYLVLNLDPQCITFRRHTKWIDGYELFNVVMFCSSIWRGEWKISNSSKLFIFQADRRCWYNV